MHHYKKRKAILLWLIGFALLSVPLLCFFITRSLSLCLIVAGISLLTGAGICLLLINEQVYQSDLLAKLSELVNTITELRDEEIFPENEDTMLSKLQNQVIKLTNILKAQKNQTAKEKLAMETVISDLSHQLKTPAATLAVYGELLTGDHLTADETSAYLRALNCSIDKLIFLIDSMVKMSRLETGLIQLKPKENEIGGTVLTAVKSIMAKAKQKSITITYEQEKEVSARHDRRWTAEAIFNILDNGVKYTPEGGEIAIKVIPYELFLRINIQDNGIGIPAEELPKIFSRFYRGVNCGEAEGLGIGLYLSRKIINGQGGYIKVSSHETGTLFSVFLPL